MRTLHIPVSMAMCFAVVAAASVSSADDKKPVQVQPQQVQPQQVQPQQVQPQQAQQPSVIIVQPPPEQKVGTTQTTGAQYPARERYVDRTEEVRPNGSLMSTGTGLFIISYAPAVVAATMSNRREDKRLYIPVAGPWLDLANRNPEARGGNENMNKAMLITSGAVQGAGALMTLGGLLIPEKRTVTQKAAEVEKPGVRIAPLIGEITGIAAEGRF